jgi:4-amino-4-deoxy-L-arabinose transferase-like glycosyltransferase
LAALLLRLVVVIATPDYVPFADAVDYDDHATSIAHGSGYPATLLGTPGGPSALRPPVYPYLLGGVYALAGDHSVDAGRVAGALLGTLTVLLLFLLARAMLGTRVALVATAIASFFPPLVVLNAGLVSEQAFLPLMLGALLATIAYRRDPRALKWAVLAGVLCGLAALTRTVGILLLVPVVVGLWRANGVSRARLLAPVAAGLVSFLVIAPWTARNLVALHAFIPISTQGGFTAIGTYNDDANTPGDLYAVWRPPALVSDKKRLLRGSLDEAELASRFDGESRRYALKHPAYVLAASGLNGLRFLDLGSGHSTVTRTFYREMGIPRALWGGTTVSAWLAVVLAFVGVFAVRRAGVAHHAFVWLTPALMFFSVVPITGGERFRAPVDPFLLLLSAAGTVAVVAWLRGRPLPMRAE